MGLLPREGRFFDAFNQHAALAVGAARELAKLFREEPDAKEIIKQKEVIQPLDAVTDKCEDVANLIEGIVLESA